MVDPLRFTSGFLNSVDVHAGARQIEATSSGRTHVLRGSRKSLIYLSYYRENPRYGTSDLYDVSGTRYVVQAEPIKVCVR